MKVLRLGIVILFFQMAWVACHDVEIGYLITEYASYEVDSMVIRKELDTTPPVQEYADIRPELLDFREFLRLTYDTYSGVAETLEAGGGDSAETMLLTFHELTSEIGVNGGYFSDLRNFFGKGDH